jgi:CubicO group peptidase (beta-lactamase class C family)
MDVESWRTRLAELAQRYRVPGVSLTVLADEQVWTATAGVLNRRTGVEVTADSLFQIGSITKAYTATLLMRLVEQGRLTLDTPVADLLPGFRVADPVITTAVTPRHLLSHTSGIDGDFFIDTGRGDDCLRRYVEACAGLGRTHPLGQTMSYCNTGYSILGRIIEVLTGMTWDAALTELLLAPAGLLDTHTLPEQVLAYRSAWGHEIDAAGDLVPAQVWGLPRSAGPAGLISATGADVIAFARLHLTGGVAADGTRVLAEETVQAMRIPGVAVPNPFGKGDHWGLGWARFDWPGWEVYGHDGRTIGQQAALRVVQQAGVAVAVLANSDRAVPLFEQVITEVVDTLIGVAVPASFVPPTVPVPVDPAVLRSLTGSYQRTGTRFTVMLRDGVLAIRVELTDDVGAGPKVFDIPLIPLADDLFAGRDSHDATWQRYRFEHLADGSTVLHGAGRATPKLSQPPR